MTARAGKVSKMAIFEQFLKMSVNLVSKMLYVHSAIEQCQQCQQCHDTFDTAKLTV